MPSRTNAPRRLTTKVETILACAVAKSVLTHGDLRLTEAEMKEWDDDPNLILNVSHDGEAYTFSVRKH